MLAPEVFAACFLRWVKSFQLDLSDKIIAIDGEASRRSFDQDNKVIHGVSAFASELNLALGQVKTAEKNYEMTAVPELLE